MQFKRYAPSDHLFYDPYKANERSLYVELALVVDKELFQVHFNFDLRSVYREMKIIANHMNAVRQFRCYNCQASAFFLILDFLHYLSFD